MSDTAYLMISGAVMAYRAAEFVAALGERFARVITVQTPNAMRLISPHDLRRIPNNHLVESYFDARILPRPTPGPVLFAPCNFNSLNKLAHGIAETFGVLDALGEKVLQVAGERLLDGRLELGHLLRGAVTADGQGLDGLRELAGLGNLLRVSGSLSRREQLLGNLPQQRQALPLQSHDLLLTLELEQDALLHL